MKFILSVSIFVLFSASQAFGVEDINSLMDQLRAESLEFNKTVTDEEIIDYLQFQYEIDENFLDGLEELKSNAQELNDFLKGYRNSHNEAGIQIPTLRGLSDEELEELRTIHEFKKKEYYQALAASESIQNLTNEQLATVLSQGIKLIQNYDTIPATPQYHTTTITEGFPPELDFLNLQLIYLYENSCSLFLQKGIGKGVGYSVVNENGNWKLESFDEYKSWERHEVIVQ